MRLKLEHCTGSNPAALQETLRLADHPRRIPRRSCFLISVYLW